MIAKFNSELPTLSMLVEKTERGIRLRPADGYVEEALNRIPYNTELEIKFYQRRSNQRLKLYWAILKRCVENKDNKYGSSEDLHSALKIALGYEHRIKRIGYGRGRKLVDALLTVLRSCWSAANTLRRLFGDVQDIKPFLDGMQKAAEIAKQLEDYAGDTIVLPGSIAFSNMSEDRFKEYFDRAMLELETAGYPISDYLKDAENRTAAYKTAATSAFGEFSNHKNSKSYPDGVKHHGPSQSQSRRDRGAEEHAEAAAEAA